MIYGDYIEFCYENKLCVTLDNKIVGMIDLRHHINHPILSVWGGHIGYSVRPTERRKGYAKIGCL